MPAGTASEVNIMRKEKKGKFKKRKIIIPILVLALAGGGIYGYSAKKMNEDVIKVVKVSEVNMPWLDLSNDEYYGTLKKGSVVNYKADEELEVDQILVKKGDTVRKGDVLFTYNTKSLEFNLETAENELKAIDNNITIANNELNILRRLQPSENAPTDEPEEEEQPTETGDVPDEQTPAFQFELKVTKDTKPVSGSGTQEDPFLYIADERTVFDKDCLIDFAENSKQALVYVCNPTGDVLYGRIVDGSKIDKDTVSDWVCSFGVNVDPMGGVSVGEETPFAKLVVYPYSINIFTMNNPTDVPDNSSIEEYYQVPEEEPSEPVNQDGVSPNSYAYEISDRDNYLYSREELKSMIEQKEKDIEKLNLDKKQAEINVKKAQAKLELGAETASISGTVTFIAKDAKHLSDSGYFATVTSSSGMSVSSYVGEFSRDKINLGDSVTISDYNSGKVYQGEITFIGDTPMKDNEEIVEGDAATESTYEFIVTTSDEFELGEDSSVNLKVNSEDTSGSIIGLELAYAREENGRFYVLVENSEGVLEKRIVETKGGIIYGSFIAVTDGLTYDDYIAMPYGKSAEGMQTVHVTVDQLYGYLGIF